jgi:hypothetical protein
MFRAIVSIIAHLSSIISASPNILPTLPNITVFSLFYSHYHIFMYKKSQIKLLTCNKNVIDLRGEPNFAVKGSRIHDKSEVTRKYMQKNAMKCLCIGRF